MSLDEVHYEVTSRLLRAWITDSFVIESYNTSMGVGFLRIFLSISDLRNLSLIESKCSLIFVDFVCRKMVDPEFEEALSLTLKDSFDDSPFMMSNFFNSSAIVPWYLIVSEKLFKSFRSEYPQEQIDSHFDW